MYTAQYKLSTESVFYKKSYTQDEINLVFKAIFIHTIKWIIILTKKEVSAHFFLITSFMVFIGLNRVCFILRRIIGNDK